MVKNNQFDNLKELVKSSSALYEDGLAFRKGANLVGRDISYKQFEHDINCLGTAFLNFGLKDKFIAVISENRYEWAMSYMAAANGTGVVVPIDCELSSVEILNQLNRCEASAVIYSEKVSEKVQAAVKSAKSIQYAVCMDRNVAGADYYLYDLLEKGSNLLDLGYDDFINAEIDNEKLSFLLFTSGTTGTVKGVMLSHKNIASNIKSIMQMVRLYKDDRLLSILPLHHTYECTCGFLTPIACGSSISYCRGIRYIANDIAEVKPTILVVVPLIAEKTYSKIMGAVSEKKLTAKIGFKAIHTLSPVLKRVLGDDFIKKVFKPVHESLGGSLRIIITGASHIDPKVVRGFINMGIMTIQGYGLTECAPLVIGNTERELRCASLGKPIPQVEVKIDSKNKKEPGEILVKGPNVMLGYYKDPESTDKTFTDGWFRTGDMALMKKNGFVYMTGRKKNIIVTKNGENIYPEELESLLNQSGLIMESVVTSNHSRIKEENSILAIIVPDIEKIKAFFKKDSVTDNEINELINDEVKKINKQMPVYKKIKDIKIRLDEFQKTTTKKIQRHKITTD